MREAVVAFEAADEETRATRVETLDAKLREQGHSLTDEDVAILDIINGGSGWRESLKLSARSRSSRGSETDRSNRSRGDRTDRSVRSWGQTSPGRRLGNETERSAWSARGDRTDRSHLSVGAESRLSARGDRTDRSHVSLSVDRSARGDRTDRSHMSEISWSAHESTTTTPRPPSRSVSPPTLRGVLNGDEDCPPSLYLASSRATSRSPPRAVSLYMAEAAVHKAAQAVERRLAACMHPCPPPPPRSRQEWNEIARLRARKRDGLALTPQEQAVLKSVDRELAAALKPVANAVLRRRKSMERPLGREARESLRALEALRVQLEARLIATAMAEDAESKRLEAEALAAAEAAALLEAQRARIEADMIAEAQAADAELARLEAEARAAAEAKAAEEARVAAESQAAAEAAAREAAALQAEAEAAAAAAELERQQKADRKAAKEAEKARKAKEAKDAARMSAKQRKLKQQSRR